MVSLVSTVSFWLDKLKEASSVDRRKPVNPANGFFDGGSMKMGLIKRKPGGKDADHSDELNRELNRLYVAACMSPYSKRHPVKHWAFARIDPSTMKAIGEDAEEFAKAQGRIP